LQIFSDASGYAFLCCIFLRTDDKGVVNVQLIMSMSRVAPSKDKMTIPRLELMGCFIAVRLTREVMRYLGEEDIPCHYWTNSSTALHWITTDKPWARFVDNRIAEIRRLISPDQWRHVPGALNPADLPSRGCSATLMLQLRW